MAKLAKMLLKHDSAPLALYDSAPPAEVNEELFNLPEEAGQTVTELVEETAPGYLRSCLAMARRAMAGHVNPFKEGDLPHKMALLLAHRMTPYRKWNDSAPEESPAEVKKTQRALKALIKSLAEDGEIIIDSTAGGMTAGETPPAATAAGGGG